MTTQMLSQTRQRGLAAALLLVSGLAGAADCGGTLVFPWSAQGKVYEVGAKTLMFVGEIKGTLYATSGKGLLDAAPMICPMLYEIDAASGENRGEGRCAIYPKGVEGVVHAVYSCKGSAGACEGRFDLSGGRGKLEGITGSGPLASRTGASEMAVKLGPGSLISNTEGLMTLNGFSCKTR